MPIYRLGDLRPELDPESWVAPDANLIGEVQLARHASVWWNATVRGDKDKIVIGEESNIQDGSVLHTDFNLQLVIGRQVTVGHNVTLHGCTIGDRCLIGIGAIILNRARIGNDCLIGAHALVPEGKEFPDRSLILGSPARLVRQLTDEEVARLPGSAGRYVRNWQRYRNELAPC